MSKQLIKIKVTANSKKNQIVENEELFKVYVTAPAVDGKANKAVIAILAEHFNKRKSRIKILRGEKAREKIIEIG
ncbi:MAG: DUF167 domain-containing protein [Nitrospiraceae bacterium]|nr:DUF167 domain-containing protein [Nitrospiraceae bacterium]